ncbi:hypothetical protein [Streptomyces malaysiensis]|nr:hypothetical protein R8789_04170 [Streptomyces malaysiensis]
MIADLKTPPDRAPLPGGLDILARLDGGGGPGTPAGTVAGHVEVAG